MKYSFETLNGRSFTLDCDPAEKLQAVINKACLSKGYRKDDAQLLLKGEVLDANVSLDDNDVDFKNDVMILKAKKGKAKRAAATTIGLTGEDDEAELSAAVKIRKEEVDKVTSLDIVREAVTKQRAELEKPTFLSKAMREELALKKLQDEKESREQKIEEQKALREEMFRNAREAGKELENERTQTKQRQQEQTAAEAKLAEEERKRQEELNQIKKKYLGDKQRKKYVPKVHSRFEKFNFGWDASDDTTAESKPLYSSELHKAQPLFGRGFRAGICSRQQLETNIDYEKELENHETETLAVELRKKKEKQRRAEIIARLREEEGDEDEDEEQS